MALPPSNTEPPYNQEKNITFVPVENILQNARLVLPRSVKVIKNEEILTNCHSKEELKEA